MYTKFFLHLGAKVICVEPQEGCLNILYKKFEKFKSVKIVDKAIGAKEECRTLYICNEKNAFTTMSNKWKEEGRFSKKFRWDNTQKVDVITLDKLIQVYGIPKFCKIDVEGCEVEVIKGLTNKIPYISFEFTKEFLNDIKICINQLLKLGPITLNFLKVGNDFEFYLSNWVNPQLLFETLNSIDDDLLCGEIFVKFL